MAYSDDKQWYAKKLIIQSRGYNILDFLQVMHPEKDWNTDFGSEPTTSELTTAWENYESKEYQRTRAVAYPELKEQLDLLYKDMAADKGDKTGEWFKAVKKVKDDNPKE